MRAALFALGLAALAWGSWLAVDFATASWRDTWQSLAIFVGGPVLHDAVVAPIVGGTALLLTRVLPPAWHTAVKAAAAATAVLVLLAIPLLWHPFGVPTNPGLHDRDYATGLLIALGVVWLVAATTGLITSKRRPTP
ncbi:hypothetical protein [Actinokineospora pegani]|uniref:hypothetical protein n=1 Tax=Actinokineospora pegani TaxID=2654637 RepID=UPI0012EB02BD|nr:hypothetical protein [Actinokineospora pegani]